MPDQENNQQERRDEMNEGDQIETQPVEAPVPPGIVVKIEQPADPDGRRHDQLEAQVSQPLQRIVFGQLGLFEGMRGAGEDAAGVINGHRQHLFRGRNILLPFPGGQMPEDGESPKSDQHPGRGGMPEDGLFEAQQGIGAVDFKAGNGHADNHQRLGPVPEPLEPLEDVDAFGVFTHGSSPSSWRGTRCGWRRAGQPRQWSDRAAQSRRYRPTAIGFGPAGKRR